MMEKFAARFARFTQTLIVAIFCLIGGIVLLHSVFLKTEYTKNAYYALLLLTLEVLALFCFYLYWGKISRKTAALRDRLSEKRMVWRAVFFLMMVLCFVIRMCWVLRYRIEPYGDYAMFHYAADSLSKSFDISDIGTSLPRYLAMFPHIFGYASFLSLVFSVFGSSPITAAITNVVLSTISAALIYYIGKKLIGRWLAVAASLIWIFFPSQITYNMLVFSEPYYTMLLLASIALFLFMWEHLADDPYWKLVLTGGLMGGVLALVNAARPVAPIVIIAFVVVLFVIQPIRKDTVGKKAAVFAGLCVIYVMGVLLNHWIFEKRIGEVPASVPGYSIYIGFNEESKGRWNQEDGALLSKYFENKELSPEEVQRKMLDAAVDRIKYGNINYPRLFYQKTWGLWGLDEGGAAYGKEVMAHPEAVFALSNGYYYFIWILSIIGVLSLYHKKEQKVLYLLPLYVIGLGMAHMFVESTIRYHYSAVLSLSLIAAYGLWEVRNKSVDVR